MEDWKKNLLKERDDLREKVKNLNSFILESVIYEVQPDEEKELMWKQLCIMRDYEAVLSDRIARF
jgi:hypothetical protein